MKKLAVIEYVIIFMLLAKGLYAQRRLAPNYVVTHQKDTILVHKVTHTDARWSDLKFTLTLPDASKKKILGEEVWRMKETRNGKVRFYQVARIEEKKRINYKLLRLVISGKLDLMYDRKLSVDWVFITGEGFNDFVTKFQNFKKLKTLLNKCEAFREAHATNKSQRYRYLQDMIRFYNQNCFR
ncbi:hypothetical protein [Winogradskyella sp.]|uniref:hypothetical protein n=1 Tax=Winogradskyella sp. TaxID=1883156 RepID=UPI002616F112|nr:hypothetical protein [Winogradskyella sp.]